MFSLFVFLSVPTSSLLSPCRLNNDFIIPVLGRDSTNDIYIKYSKVLGFCLVLKILSYLNEMPYLILHLMNQVMICILFLLLICWKLFQNLIFPEHTKKMYCESFVLSLVKGIKSLFSLRSDIKLEISVQKTNKGLYIILSRFTIFSATKILWKISMCKKRDTLWFC